MVRRKLPVTRNGVTHKVVIYAESGEHSYFVTVNLHKDGTPGEVFVKEAQNDAGFLDQWAKAISIALQHGYTTADLVRWYAWARYEPSGMTDNPDIRMAKSPTDYIVRWMHKQWGKEDVVEPAAEH